MREYFRPNLFANTPDILHAYLQHGGRRRSRRGCCSRRRSAPATASTAGSSCAEARALAPGTEEYADSEKYQFRKWDWDRPGHIQELVTRVNAIRHAHRALQFDHTLQFHDTDNAEIIAYSKTRARRHRPRC